MAQQMIALVIGHDYRIGGPVKPKDLIAKIDMFKNLLESRIPCRQVGACTFTVDASLKECAFAAIEQMEDTLGFHCLKVNFASLETLDDEFERWKRKQYGDVVFIQW